MKVISQKLGTALAAMTVKNSKELYLVLRLLLAIWLKSRLFQIQHYRDSVLIVVPDEAIVSVRAVGYHVGQQNLL